MFVVPKETQLLIFHLPIDASMDNRQIKMLEKKLTEQTGIRCVVYDDVIDEGDYDFKIRWVSREKSTKEVDEPSVMLNKEPKDKGDQRNSNLENSGFISFLCNTGLFSLKFQAFLLLCFCLGLLVGYLLGL